MLVQHTLHWLLPPKSYHIILHLGSSESLALAEAFYRSYLYSTAFQTYKVEGKKHKVNQINQYLCFLGRNFVHLLF